MAKVKKTLMRKPPRPSSSAMVAAKAMLAPLHDLLVASVKQNELNAEMLTNLNDHVVKLAAQLDQLQKIASADSKLITEPAPAPVVSLLTESS